MARCQRARLLVAVAAAVAVAGVAAPARAQQTQPPRLLFLFDASGSMKKEYGDGRAKIDAAKDAAVTLLDQLPSQTQVGLRVFGGGRPPRPVGPACQDTQLVLPIGPLDRDDAERQIRSFSARGRTPIAFALRQAAQDLGGSGSRTIVLVSDGQDTCQPPPPCDVAREVARGGVDVRIQAIGLRVGPKARRELKCIAAAGGGIYRDANDTAALQEELQALSTRALRQYIPRGTPIQGGRTAQEAADIAPGRYVDEMPPDSERWYAIDLARGETLKASASFIPPDRKVADKAQFANSSMDIVTPSFDIPDIQNSSAGGSPFERRGYVDGLGVVSRPIGVGGQANPDEPFSKPGRYYLKLGLEDDSSKSLFDAVGGEPIDVELSVEVLGREGGSPAPPSDDGDADSDDGDGPSVPATATPDEPPGAALLAAVAFGLGALGFAGGLVLLRRRRSA